MRGRALIGAGLAVVVIGAGAIALLSLGGESKSDRGVLRWTAKPVVFAAPNLPNDRIATGTIRNASLKPIHLEAMRDIKVIDDRGRELTTSAVFSQTYGHGLFSPSRIPYARLPEQEKLRIGHAGELKPGREIPVTVAWRETPKGPHAAEIRYPGGTLPIGRVQELLGKSV